MASFFRRITLSALVVVLWATVAAPVAGAHEASVPTTTVIDDVDLEVDGLAVEGLEVEIESGGSDLLVIRWQGEGRLQVLDADGAPFVRIDDEGVEGNLGRLAWFESNDPLGIVTAEPGVVEGTAPDDWQRVSDVPAWSLFDHRLHPADIELPDRADREATLADWEVPLRVEQPAGATEDAVEGAVRGRIVFEPLLGSYRSSLRSGLTDDRVLAQLIPGAVPAFFVRVLDDVQVVVEGSGGEPFLRLSPGGVEANLASPSWLAHTRLADLTLPDVPVDPTADPVWEAIADAPSYTWLDPRAGSGIEGPPEDPATATVVSEWVIPLQIDGVVSSLTGDTQWVPLPQPTMEDEGFDWTRLLLLCGGAAVAALAVSGVWRRRSAS